MSVRVFPSTITEDPGRIITEQNLKSILDFITSRDVVIEGFGITSMSTQHISLEYGKIIMQGYQLECYDPEGNTGISYTLQFPKEITEEDELTYTVFFRIKFLKSGEHFIDYYDYRDPLDPQNDNKVTSVPLVIIPTAFTYPLVDNFT